ncbi:MAG: LPXTG cell wall anchor domain-containing protein, partial [Bacilli bacterium]|nr:LPXTG cell wall anchor domain-containing protein [Bacilli bacterium]
SETGTLIEQAMSKYDHIVARYGFESFIAGRTVSSVSPKLFNVDSSSSISIIVIIALVSAAAIGGYLILKRRKEN